MGLTKEVRDFFTGRINRLLNAKLQAIYEKIDRDAIKAQAVTRLLVDIKVPTTVLKRFAEIEAERDRLYAEENEIKNLIYNSVEKVYPKANVSRYSNGFVSEVEHFALGKFEKKVLSEVHPELVVEIEKINRVREDVESVVLLSTTEPRLVARLTAVLQKYGGDGIPELLEYIPD